MKREQNRRQLGAKYEDLAAEFLRKQGYEILEKNFRCRQGEVDLIARDGDCLVFVEVKYRSRLGRGSSLDAVDRKKQRVIARTAAWYLSSRAGTADLPCRFDVVGVDGERLTLVKNAFWADGYS